MTTHTATPKLSPVFLNQIKRGRSIPPDRIPRTEAEYARVLAAAGIRVPKSGRPRKGENCGSTIMHLRIPNKAYAVFKRRATRKGTSATRLAQLALVRDALGE